MNQTLALTRGHQAGSQQETAHSGYFKESSFPKELFTKVGVEFGEPWR